MADSILQQDYRGLRLCPVCWNGMHFTSQTRRSLCRACRYAHKHGRPYQENCKTCRWVSTGVKICQCLLGGCECPCSRFQSDLETQLQGRRAKREANRKAQLSFFAS